VPDFEPVYALTGHPLPINDAALSADGRLALLGSEDRTVRLVDVEAGREVRCLRGHTDHLCAVALSADGRRALSAGRDGTVRLWDAAAGRELRRLEGHTNVVFALAFSPDGSRALSGAGEHYREGKWAKGEDHSVRLWDVETGRQLAEFAGHTRAVFSVAFSADGRRAASGSADQTARVWNLPH
jgi:WD40 repeat protein